MYYYLMYKQCKPDKYKMRLIFSFAMMFLCSLANAQESRMITVNVSSQTDKQDEPVVIDLKKYGEVKSAVVRDKNTEIPCQLDDIDGDEIYDELCFVTDVKKKETKKINVTLFYDGQPRQYEARTFAEMLMRNPKVKEKNKHDLFVSSISMDGSKNTYNVLHHHGVAFESELVAMRIYYDHRQTLDLYGKKQKRLELEATQFYTQPDQAEQGYGDDVFWCGQSFGLGAIRGYDGEKQVMLTDVKWREQRVIASGPVRAVVEVKDRQWKPIPTAEPITMTVRYTIYAGHRDVVCDVKFSKNVHDYLFTTGITNVKCSTEFSDSKGLRGCWGSDYAVGGKDTLTHKKETVGLGIFIPQKYIINEEKANSDNYPFVVATDSDNMRYYLTYTSDNETFGYHNQKDWFSYLKAWRDNLESTTAISVE